MDLSIFIYVLSFLFTVVLSRIITTTKAYKGMQKFINSHNRPLSFVFFIIIVWGISLGTYIGLLKISKL